MPAVTSLPAQSAVFRAIGLARAGRWAQARALVDRALARGSEDALVVIAAAAVRYVSRDYQGALELLDHAAGLDDALLEHALEDRIRYAISLGWDQEVRATTELATTRQPDEPRWYAHAAQCWLRSGASERALKAASKALELAPDSVAMRIRVASLLAELGRNAQATHAAKVAAARAPDRGVRHLGAIARILRNAGAFDEARARLEQLQGLRPSSAAGMELVELDLWRGDVASARARLDAMQPDDGVHAPHHRARGILHMLAGAPQDAIAGLEAAIEADGTDASTLVWRAEAAYRLGDDEGAHRWLSRATMQAEGHLFVAWMLRVLVVSREGGDDEVKPHHVEEFREALVEIVPEAAAVLARGLREPLTEAIETALTRMRGNRTSIATFVDDDGGLRRVQARTGVRHASRQALQLIRALPPAQVIEALDEVVARWPEASLPICHRGELYLWLGDLRRARADLQAAIDLHRFTRWAYIGLTGIDLLEGNPQAALRTSADGVRTMSGTEGPAVYAYRGEAYLRSGRWDEARADLEKVVSITPTRIGAWFDLALVHAATDDLDAFERVWDHLERAALGLVSDAAREVGVELWPHAQARATVATRRRVIEHAVEMMRGNRSTSCPTYFTREGALRFVQPYAEGVKGPHADDGRILDRAQTLLGGHGRLLRSRGPRRAARPAPGPGGPSTLAAQDLEHYLERGFVMVRGCFSRDVAAQWVAQANRRIREAPERWIKGYDPDDAARSLRGYDPGDPTSWTWSRLNLAGTREVAIPEFSPRLWGALCDILGGEDRIGTRTLSDYFVVNFRGEIREGAKPKPDSESWHIDAPSRRTTLHGFDNGAVLVLLFSDLLPSSGNTWLALDSVGHVARQLADHPEGVDYVDPAAAPRLCGRCREFAEITGDAGDVAILHPFMVHSGSPNPSGRIRWMSNPNIRLASPLRIDRPNADDHAPVEQVIRRALQRS